MSHVVDQLAELTLGMLEPGEARAVHAHIAGCAPCAAEALSLREAVAMFALARAPVGPSPTIRARVLAGAAHKARSPGRFSRYVNELATYFDIAAGKARALLDEIDEPAAWEDGPLPGVSVMHFSGGPRLALADCGFVRIPGGTRWPLHRHLGRESTFVFEGALVEEGGSVWREGSVLHREPGSQHAFEIPPDGDCLCAVILFEGLEMPPGQRIAI